MNGLKAMQTLDETEFKMRIGLVEDYFSLMKEYLEGFAAFSKTEKGIIDNLV